MAEYEKMYASLRHTYGPDVKLSVISPDAQHPSLYPITNYGIYTNIACQSQGVNLYTDLAASFTVPELYANDIKNFFTQTNNAWSGEIRFAVRTKKTAFSWKITANWRRIHEHFKAQTTVKYWFVKANLSYETQRLIQNEHLKIEIAGGTPSDKEKIYNFAEKIAERLFVPTLQASPMPGHPSGAAVCVSVNYQKVEEDKTTVWEGSEQDFEVRPLGLAAYVGRIPEKYFAGFDSPAALGLYDVETGPGAFDIVEYVGSPRGSSEAEE